MGEESSRSQGSEGKASQQQRGAASHPGWRVKGRKGTPRAGSWVTQHPRWALGSWGHVRDAAAAETPREAEAVGERCPGSSLFPLTHLLPVLPLNQTHLEPGRHNLGRPVPLCSVQEKGGGGWVRPPRCPAGTAAGLTSC